MKIEIIYLSDPVEVVKTIELEPTYQNKGFVMFKWEDETISFSRSGVGVDRYVHFLENGQFFSLREEDWVQTLNQ